MYVNLLIIHVLNGQIYFSFYWDIFFMNLIVIQILEEKVGLYIQGIIFLVSHRNLLCIFDMTAIQNIFCVADFFHRSVQNLI